jgi:hypothetical protein
LIHAVFDADESRPVRARMPGFASSDVDTLNLELIGAP